MRDDRAKHDDGKQDGRIESIAGNKQSDAGRHLQKTVKYRNHWPRPTLSNNSTITAVPANFPPPAPIKARATRPERVHRVMRRPLPAAAGSAFVVIIKFLSMSLKALY